MNQDISLTFKNKVNDQAKLDKYYETLSKLQTMMNNMPKNMNFGNVNISGLNKTLNEMYKQITNNVRATATLKKSLSGSLGVQGEALMDTAKLATFTTMFKKTTAVMSKATNKSAEYVENLNLLEVAYGKATKQGEKFINHLSEMYGLDESTLVKTVGLFKQLSNAMGITGDTGTKMSEVLTQLAIDTSSLYNTSFETAVSKMESALSGLIRLARLKLIELLEHPLS